MTSRSQISRRTRRTRQAAALIEGLVVASLLALFLSCGVFFHHLYSGKLKTMRDARSAAWRDGLHGCAGGFAAGLLNMMGSLTALTEADQAGLLDAPDWLRNAGRGVGDPPAVRVQSGALMGGRTFDLRTRTSVACNDYADQAQGDSYFATVFQYVRDMVISR